jgi:hypothetical protein
MGNDGDNTEPPKHEEGDQNLTEIRSRIEKSKGELRRIEEATKRHSDNIASQQKPRG